MANFYGTAENDLANAAMSQVVGFTGGSVAELNDGVGDFFTGVEGEDIVFAGDGNDVIEGGEGHDTLNGGAGNDQIAGYIPGLDQNGSLIGDEIVGNDGNDVLIGSGGDDVIDGGADDDSVIGGGGNDFLQGGDGKDRLEGGPGADTLLGGAVTIPSFSARLTGRSRPLATLIDGGLDEAFNKIAVDVTASFVNATSISNIEGLFFVRASRHRSPSAANQVKTAFPAILTHGGVRGHVPHRNGRRDGRSTVREASHFVDWNAAEDRIDIVGDADDEIISGTSQDRSSVRQRRERHAGRAMAASTSCSAAWAMTSTTSIRPAAKPSRQPIRVPTAYSLLSAIRLPRTWKT